MPEIPSNIDRAIGHSSPKEQWHGEEGILDRILLHRGWYFAKRWRGKHYEGERAGSSITLSAESERSPVSPFWVKVKYYEAKLIHDAFPDTTLEMPIAYDPRVTKDAAGEAHFTYDEGRPVTAVNEVAGDPALREERDRVIREAYDAVWQSRGVDSADVVVPVRDCGAFYRADFEMAQRFGYELGPIVVSHDREIAQWIDRNIQNMRHQNPTSDLIPMLEAGLIPIHPGVNFIPTAEKDPERGAQGVYLEVAVGDPERLRKALHARCADDACRTQVDARMDRYLMYRLLDDAMDDVLYEQRWVTSPAERFANREMYNRLFAFYRAVQERIEREGIAETVEWLPAMRRRIMRGYLRAFGMQDQTGLVAMLDELRGEVERGAAAAAA